MTINDFNIKGNLVVNGVAIESDGTTITLPSNAKVGNQIIAEIVGAALAPGFFSVAADDSTEQKINSGETVQFVGANGISTSSDAEGRITITGTTVPSISGLASETYVNTQISNLVDSSPAALDTLNELAAALGDDANFSTTVTDSIATKLPLAGGTMTGNLTVNGAGLTVTNEYASVNIDGSSTAQYSGGTLWLSNSATADNFGVHLTSQVADADTTGSNFSINEVNSAGTYSKNILSYNHSSSTLVHNQYNYFNAGLGVTGNIAVSGTVDGRDVAVDGTKLDGIATGANNYVDADVDTHLNTSTATTGEVLSWTGTDYDWIAAGGGGGSAFTTPEVKTSSWSVTNVDKGKVFIIDTDNLTLTLPEDSTLDSDWFIRIYTKGNSFQPSYGQVGDLTIDPQYSLHGGRVNGNTNWIMRSRQGGILFVDPEQDNNFIFDTHSTNWDIDVHSTANANRANATGWGGVAISGQATASATGAVAIGYLSYATGTDSVAIGGNSAQAVSSQAIALGNSYAGGAGSFAAAITNNTNSYGATGANSVAIGQQAKASNSGATAIGQFNQATSFNSTAIGGYSNQATQLYSVAIGGYASSSIINKMAFGNYSLFSVGVAQAGTFVFVSNTTDATPKALTANNSTAGTTNQVILPNNSAYSFHGTIVARQQASQGTATAAWKIEGLIRREGSAGTTVLVNSATTVLDNTPAWGMALSADTTNGGLAITVTGAAATNIRFVATINTSEVTY